MKRIAMAVLLVSVVGGTARADWDEGDPYKMHFPQMPDPDGWDLAFSYPTGVVADDWQCSESGLVTGIHFWFSKRQDNMHQIYTIHAGIHGNCIGSSYDFPGDALWERDFLLDEEDFSIRTWGIGDQGWYDPHTSEMTESDHLRIYQANITDIPDPFVQQVGETYWLTLWVDAGDVGWKSSADHYGNSAVWATPDGPGSFQWQALNEPFSGGQQFDLAFVITPEPATMALLGLGIAGLMLKRRRRK